MTDELQTTLKNVLLDLGLSYDAWRVILLFIVKVVVVIVLLILTWIGVRRLALMLERWMVGGKVEPTVGRFIANLVQWGLFGLVVILCMSFFGIETTSFAAIMGGGSVALGLAFQGSLSNVAAGVMLLVFRPYKIGDYIKVEGNLVIVYAIELFFTTVDTFDNRRLFIPNSKLFGNVIENHTFHDERRVDITMGLGYDADLSYCRRILEEATLIDGVTRRQIYLDNIGSFTINWKVRCWTSTADYFRVKEALVFSLKSHCDQAGIEMPFPYTVNIVRHEGEPPPPTADN